MKQIFADVIALDAIIGLRISKRYLNFLNFFRFRHKVDLRYINVYTLIVEKDIYIK